MDRTKEHSLHDILIIAVLAMLCGGESFVDFQDFGRAKEDWLRTFLQLPSGIPSHDTFGRVFALLDPLAVCRVFLQLDALPRYSWTYSKGELFFVDIAENKIYWIGLDGKVTVFAADAAHANSLSVGPHDEIYSVSNTTGNNFVISRSSVRTRLPALSLRETYKSFLLR